MAARWRALLGFLSIAGVTGCNEILGIEERPPKPPSTSASTAGSGGHGGDPGAGGGSEVFWARRFGDTTPEQSFRVAVDSQGGVLVSAIFGGFLSFDRVLQASGPSDGCALKLSPDGNPEWSFHARGDGAQSVEVGTFDMSDVPYVAGNFSGPTMLGDFPLLAPTTPDFYVARLGTDGQPTQPFTWSNATLHDMVVHESGFSVVGAFNGALTLSGTSALTSTEGRDGFVAQMDANGNAEWANSVAAGASDAEIRRAARDGAVTILLAHATTPNGPVAFLAFANNADGNLLTTSWGNLHGYVDVSDIVITPSATIVIVGSYTGNVQFDGNILQSEDVDIFFLAFRLTGSTVNVLAFKRFGGVGRDVPRGLTVTPAGVAMTGAMSSAIDFGAPGDPHPLAYVAGEDGFVVELTEDGDFVKGVGLGGPANQEGRDLALHGNAMVVTGIMEETLTIDGEMLYSGGMSDIFVAKMQW